MAISIDLPGDLEQSLRREVVDLERTAKEAFLVELYRQRKLTHAQLASALGLARFEVDDLLKRHGIYLEMTPEDVSRESEGLRKLRENHAGRR